MSTEVNIAKVILIRRLRKRLKRQQRSCSIRPIFYNRFEQGESFLTRELRDDPHYHGRYFRMSEENFTHILEKVSPSIQRRMTHSRPISPLEKLAITLRYLATGNSQVSLSLSYRISPSSVSNILRETMNAICRVFEQEQLPVPTEETWRRSAEGFESKRNFPNCCGAIDGKHVRIRAPSHSGSMNFNYKGFYSLVLLAVVDAHNRFVVVDIGASGSQSDGGILMRSCLGKALYSDDLKLPDSRKIGEVEFPYVIVGDDAFPLKQNLLKPYPGKLLTVEQRIFNYRLSRARIVVEHAFGILSAQWRIYHSVIDGDVEFIKLIIKTTVILHNLLRGTDEQNTTDETYSSQVPRRSRDLIGTQGSNNYSNAAADVRNQFSFYFNGEGSVSWQHEMIKF